MKARIKGTDDPFREIYTIEIKGVNGLYSPDDIEFEQELMNNKDMDYEQKYKEALERAKGAHNSAKSDKENGVTDKITEYTIQLTETIFSELKESEDEKMRKSIIYALRNGGFYNKDKTDEAIAWLEKQSDKTQGESALEAANEENADNANKVENKQKSSSRDLDWYI